MSNLIRPTNQLYTGNSDIVLTDVRPLIVENVDKVLTEAFDPKDGKKKTFQAMRVTGVFQEAESHNANSRIYPVDILQEAVGRIQPLVQARRVLGEFDHPADAKIHLDRVSHLITKLWMEGNRVMGQAEVLDHLPYGAQLKGLIEHGVTVGISSRGVGDMEAMMKEGRQLFKVLPGYMLITFDVVAEPSVSTAQLSVMESISRQRHNGDLVKKHNEYKILQAFKKELL